MGVKKEESEMDSRLLAFAGSLTGVYSNYDFESDRRDAWGEKSSIHPNGSPA